MFSKSRGQKGFTLVELMIAVAIMGIISAVIAQLFTAGVRGWLFSNASILSNQQARTARNLIIKMTRNASASTVMIERYDADQPPLSMISFTDVKGNNYAFYQDTLYNDDATPKPVANRLVMSGWELSGGVRVPTTDHVLISKKLQVFSVYYPNVKDMRNINFSII